ncbi:metalloendopeptidase [Coemansia sp. RSA 1933]|nr:metalloendopeptidase [Coemansia sp. RSA 1933]
MSARVFRVGQRVCARWSSRGTIRSFGSKQQQQQQQRPGGGGTYRRFNNNPKQPLWQSRNFWYATGAGGVGCAAYYQAHIDESPTGRRRFINVSRGIEEYMGRQSYRQVMAQYGRQIVAQGSPMDVYVQRVARRVIAATGMEAKWEIHVIDSPERNAFVLPGGKIFVFSGILPITAGEDGLATVLAHEIAHQYARHTAEQISRSLVGALALFIASLFIDPTILDIGSTSARLLLALPNSRDCEAEADQLGLSFMAAACYDPRQAVGFWQRMRAEESQSPPQFLSTHPSSATRIDNIRKWMPDAMDKRIASSCPDPLLTDAFFSSLVSDSGDKTKFM